MVGSLGLLPSTTTRASGWSRRALLLLLVAAALPACKKEPPLDEAIALIDSDPKAAAARLEEIHKSDPSNYDALFYLATAWQEAEEWDKAIPLFEEALGKPEGKATEGLIKDRLYTAYMAQADKGGDVAIKTAALEKAAALEEELGKRNIRANKKLMEARVAAFDKAVEEERFDDAIEVANSVRKLYVDKKEKRPLLTRITELRKRSFLKKAYAAFHEKIKPDLAAKGNWEEGSARLLFASEFVVPPKTEEGEWDEAAAGFEEVAKGRACMPLAVQLGQTVNAIAEASPFGAKLEDAYMNYFANEASRTMASGWKTPHAADAVRAEGEEWAYTCKMFLPLETVIDNLYLVHREKEKQAKGGEGAKPAQAPEKAPAPEGAAPAPEGAAPAPEGAAPAPEGAAPAPEGAP
ncbi:MAG: hypothetical protein AMXMBFR64_28940 [Myxococcales bacterium]